MIHTSSSSFWPLITFSCPKGTLEDNCFFSQESQFYQLNSFCRFWGFESLILSINYHNYSLLIESIKPVLDMGHRKSSVKTIYEDFHALYLIFLDSSICYKRKREVVYVLLDIIFVHTTLIKKPFFFTIRFFLSCV